MKLQILLKTLENAGFYFVRHGGNHDVYSNGDITIAIPRHREINEILAKKILKEAGI